MKPHNRAIARTGTSLTRRIVAIGAVVLSSALLVPLGPAVQARGPDTCPEPNDEFQQACLLPHPQDISAPDAAATGYLFHPNDIDAYLFNVLEFGVTVHFELTEMPAPYRLILADWRGRPVATSSDQGSVEAVTATLGPPGAYYLFVDSRFGDFTDDVPYRVVRRLTYPAAPVPRPLWSNNYLGASQHQSLATADHIMSGGRRTIAFKVAGTPAEPKTSSSFLASGDERQRFGDFTLSMDTRIEAGDHAGFHVEFAQQDGRNTYRYVVSMREGGIGLNKRVDGQSSPIVPPTSTRQWLKTDALDTTGGVNRTVLRRVGTTVTVNLNGVTILQAEDETFREGQIHYGATTWGSPAVVHFDNILVTTPTQGP